MAEADYKNIRLATFALVFHGTLLLADGGSITWYEPPPFETVTNDIVAFTSFQNLTEGSVNKELSFNFSLTADLNIVSVSIELDGDAVATYIPYVGTPSVELAFVGRFNAIWVPNKLTLIVLNVTSADRGRYRCEVLTSGGGVKRWKRMIEVHVFEPPTIIKVSGFTVHEGGNTTLKCLAQGKPTPSITWTRLSDGSNITWTRLPDGSVISRTLVNITRQNASVGYRCIAANGVGNPDIRDVFIDVQYGGSVTWYEPPPLERVTDDAVSFTSFKNLIKGSLNKELSFNFSLTADLTILSVTIELGGDAVATYVPSQGTPTVEPPFDGRFNVTWVPSKLTLIVLNVSSADKGRFRCEVLTSGGGLNRWKRIIEVDVFEPPKIIEVSGFTVREGGNTTLKCLAEGKPAPSITWTRLSDGSNITWTRRSDGSVISRTLVNIIRENASVGYRCTATNGVGNPDTRVVFTDVQFAPEKTSLSTNLSTVPVVCAGTVVNFTCTVEASNPTLDTFVLYENGSMISNKTDTGVWIRTLDTGGEVTYKCQANNSIGTRSSENISLTIEVSASASAVSNSVVAREGQNVTLGCNGFGLPAPNISWFNEKKVVMENGRIWSLYEINRNMAGQYTCTASNSCGHDSQKIDVVVQYHVEATESGENATVPEGRAKRFSCPVAGNPTPNIKWYKGSEPSGAPISNEKELEATENGCYTCLASNSLGTSVSITQCLMVVYESSSTVPSTTVSEEFKCNCPNNETALSVIIGVLVIIIVVLIAIIIWQQKKLRGIRNKRPYEVPEEKDTGFYDNEIAMKHVDPTHLRPKNATQQQIPNELQYMPLQGISPTGEGPICIESPALNVEYAPLDVRTRSWEVARNDVKVEKIIGKGAFGQVAAGTAKNLPLRSGTTIVAIKMVKANAPETDKRDLEAELELMKTLKPHPHVIKLLGCVTESEPLLVLIEYVPYGDLLGYLRKSRGLNDTYYKDPDIKPKTSLTSQQLMKFAWQIADGMSYLSLRKVVHRDLAARNVLVGESETCKITDFGMARDVQEENIYERKTKGRLPVKWTAYESLLYGQYTTKSDVWSYGVVLYEISTIGGSPYPRMEGRKIASLLQQGYRMPKPEHVDNDLYQIMMNCWQCEPKARPSFSDLTQQLKRMENQHKKLINMHIYDNTLYAHIEDLNA